MIHITLRHGKEQSAKRLHPWIFSGAIAKMSGTPDEGDLVKVYSADGEFLAIGHYQKSSIAVRILSFNDIAIDQNFWNERIASAYNYRKQLGLVNNSETNCYRLVHGEGDNLSGLVIDYYNGTAVVQCHSVGMFKNLDCIAKSLQQTMGEQLTAIYNKSESTLPFKAGIENKDGLLWGEIKTENALEYGNSFFIDWIQGQKTGFFIDQRENRKLVEHYAKGKSVLNTFCYTGGFSVYALRGGAKKVVSVDCSARAIELTDKTVAMNFPNAEHTSVVSDTFKYLDNNKDEFDLIILDPPAFAKHGKVLNNALQGYKRLNMKAIEQIKKGGILFTFSCSQAVSKEEFRKSVFAAAANTKRNVRILHQLTQPADHPISIYHPEGEYLKGLVLEVE
ncbi:MAG: class I SAM-dependent rRNA methyltransferase [Bacteroidales bacterium]|nr:class I SAM-dependent rRNA methyltransferase [Bacteroidales bacterium]MBR4690023.1 class I SAM-dependent rRNA methyltransferase [Bacteroidales bacterium]MBR7034914.1 class I SAM-dependent rRNA methyltransferase [Bacteroidales bacterium]